MHNVRNEAKQCQRREEVKALRVVAQYEELINKLSSQELARRLNVDLRHVQPAYVKRIIQRGKGCSGGALTYDDAYTIDKCIKERELLEMELKEFKRISGL